MDLGLVIYLIVLFSVLSTLLVIAFKVIFKKSAMPKENHDDMFNYEIGNKDELPRSLN